MLDDETVRSWKKKNKLKQDSLRDKLHEMLVVSPAALSFGGPETTVQNPLKITHTIKDTSPVAIRRSIRSNAEVKKVKDLSSQRQTFAQRMEEAAVVTVKRLNQIERARRRQEIIESTAIKKCLESQKVATTSKTSRNETLALERGRTAVETDTFSNQVKKAKQGRIDCNIRNDGQRRKNQDNSPIQLTKKAPESGGNKCLNQTGVNQTDKSYREPGKRSPSKGLDKIIGSLHFKNEAVSSRTMNVNEMSFAKTELTSGNPQLDDFESTVKLEDTDVKRNVKGSEIEEKLNKIKKYQKELESDWDRDEAPTNNGAASKLDKKSTPRMLKMDSKETRGETKPIVTNRSQSRDEKKLSEIKKEDCCPTSVEVEEKRFEELWSNYKRDARGDESKRKPEEEVNESIKPVGVSYAQGGDTCPSFKGELHIFNNFNTDQGSKECIEGYEPYKRMMSKNDYLESLDKAMSAIKIHKTFAIAGRGTANTIRRALLARGWIEKFAEPTWWAALSQPGNAVHSSACSAVPLDTAPNPCSLVMSQMIDKHKLKFIWAGAGPLDWSQVAYITKVNRFPWARGRPPFTSKIGLCRCLDNQMWTSGLDVPLVKYPRTFEIRHAQDIEDFSNHYRMTACYCMVRIFLNSDPPIDHDYGEVPLDSVDFAIKRLCEYVTFEESADLDSWSLGQVQPNEWHLFMFNFHDVTINKKTFKASKLYNPKELISVCRTVANAVKKYWIGEEAEGVNNIWIVKPGYSSRGRGVSVHRSLYDITDKCKAGKQYIVQKYIERPFTVFDTKFDIRQWFLITSIYPLTIWMYDEFYVRFSSQLFQLDNTHESIHLCNNSIQYKYTNQEGRHQDLPKNNMWTCHQLKNYLKSVGRCTTSDWNRMVVEMEKSFIGAALSAQQESMRHRAHSFSLLGADFVLDSNLSPWLIEVNSSPAMGPTTSVTRDMCTKALIDLVKVVVDRDSDKKADTGLFRLVYRQRSRGLASVGDLDDPSAEGGPGELRLLAKKAKIYQITQTADSCYTDGSTSKTDTSTSTLTKRTLKYEDLRRRYKVMTTSRTKMALEEKEDKLDGSEGKRIREEYLGPAGVPGCIAPDPSVQSQSHSRWFSSSSAAAVRSSIEAAGLIPHGSGIVPIIVNTNGSASNSRTRTVSNSDSLVSFWPPSLKSA